MSTPAGTPSAETLSVGDVATGGASGGATPGTPTEIAAPNVQTTSTIDPANINNGPSPGTGQGGFSGDPGADKGILARAWDSTKEFAGSSLGKEVLSGGVKQVGAYIMGGGSDMQEFEQQLKAGSSRVLPARPPAMQMPPRVPLRPRPLTATWSRSHSIRAIRCTRRKRRAPMPQASRPSTLPPRPRVRSLVLRSRTNTPRRFPRPAKETP